VAEGIEDRGDLVGNVVRNRKGVHGGNHEVIGESTRAIDAYADRVAAQVPAARAAVAAVTADDVALAGDALADVQAPHLRAHRLHRAHVFVTHVHGNGNGVLRPLV